MARKNTTYSVDYKVFKRAIERSAHKAASVNRELAFTVDLAKTDTYIGDTGCISIKVNKDSNPVLARHIPFLSEYFIKQKLAWFDEAKEFTTIIFVQNDSNDAELQQLLELIERESQTSTDEYDLVKLLAEVVAKYPCYFAVVVSYISNDPQYANRLSYSIVCRANKVTIESERYEYNPADMS